MSLACLQACTKDSSTLDINKIQGVKVDTSGIGTIEVYQFDVLELTPHIDAGDLSDDNFSYDKAKNILIQLADTFIKDDVSWPEAFPILYSFPQPYSYFFGKRLYELMKNDSIKVGNFISESIKSIDGISKEKRNVAVLAGFVSEMQISLKKEIYYDFYNSKTLDYLLFYFISADKNGQDSFDLLFNLVDNKKYGIESFYAFDYSEVIRSLTLDELFGFIRRLFEYGDEGYSVGFTLLFDLSYNNEELKKSIVPIYKECI